MHRIWVQRAVSEDGRAIATAINSVSIPAGIQARVRRSAIARAGCDRNSSYSSSHSSIQVEWSAQTSEPSL